MHLAESGSASTGEADPCGSSDITDVFSAMWVVIATYVFPVPVGADCRVPPSGADFCVS